MLTVSLNPGLFAFFTVVARPCSSGLKCARRAVAGSSPDVGMGITVLGEFLQQVGQPSRRGPAVTNRPAGGLARGLPLRRPAFPFRKPCRSSVLVSSSSTTAGRVRFGFNWISYGNDDMANYNARRRALPEQQLLFPAGADPAQAPTQPHFWSCTVQQIGRQRADPGVDLLDHRLNPHQVFIRSSSR